MFEIVERYGQKALVTRKAHRAGQDICAIPVESVHSRPDRLTVQIRSDLHARIGPLLEAMNHACVPNCEIDVVTMSLRALRDLREGEEMTFFYPSTEWEMASPFHCHCGSAHCLGVIQGARWLEEKDWRGRSAPHIAYLRREHAKKGILESLYQMDDGAVA